MFAFPLDEVPDEDAQEKYIRALSKIKVPDSFPLKYNKKKYSLHHVAFPGTWQIDLMIGKNKTNWFLVAIEVNTRYLFIERTSTYVYDTNCKKVKDQKGNYLIECKSEYAIGYAFLKLLKKGWNPSTIVCDHEKAFNSNFLKNNFYKKLNIAYKPVYLYTDEDGRRHANHTSLAIVNRVIRSCRKWLEMKECKKQALPVKKVMEFVSYYNNRPHSKLCKIFNNKITTPKMVHDNMEMEMIVIQRILRENREIRENVRGLRIPTGSLVKLYNPDIFKRSRITKIDSYRIVSSNGNIYTVKNINEKLKDQKEEKVPCIGFPAFLWTLCQ